MKLKNGMYLYHGSYAPIETIDLSLCLEGKDFGKGFYLTSDFEQARSFVKNSIKKAKNMNMISDEVNHGYVTTFQYVEQKESCTTFTFDDTNKEWLWYVAMNRRNQLSEILKDDISSRLLNAEIVIGKIANDRTNPTITAYLNGLYGDIKSDESIQFTIKQLMPNKLKDQYCFKSEKAISCLDFVEVTEYEG